MAELVSVSVVVAVFVISSSNCVPVVVLIEVLEIVGSSSNVILQFLVF